MVLNAVHDAGEQWASAGRQRRGAFAPTPRPAPRPRPLPPTGPSAARPRPGCRSFGSCSSACTSVPFPMAVLLMLTPAGGAFSQSVPLGGFIWLQSWGPLYAILHRISLGEKPPSACRRRGADAQRGDAGISLVAQAGIRAVAADVAVMSGPDLSMSVPFLAAALAYGVGRATALASSVLHVGQEAAIGSPRARGLDGQSFARLHATGHAPVRDARRPPAPYLRPRRHGPLHGFRAGRRRVTPSPPTAPRWRTPRSGDEPPARRGHPAVRIPRLEPREPGHAIPHQWPENYSAEAAMAARSAAATDATALVERHSKDVNVGTAHAHSASPKAESRTRPRSCRAHVDRLSEIGGITKDQAAAMTAEASLGGSWREGRDPIAGAERNARSWRGPDHPRARPGTACGTTASSTRCSTCGRRSPKRPGDTPPPPARASSRASRKATASNLTRMRAVRGPRLGEFHRRRRTGAQQAAQVRAEAQSD